MSEISGGVSYREVAAGLTPIDVLPHTAAARAVIAARSTPPPKDIVNETVAPEGLDIISEEAVEVVGGEALDLGDDEERVELLSDEEVTDLLLQQLDKSVGAKGGDAGISDSVGVYLRSIGRTRGRLLKAQEEVELAKQIEAGLFAEERLLEGGGLDAAEVSDLRTLAAQGKWAKNMLIERNLRLVVSLAKRYVIRGLTFLDLIQEGNIGLIRAVEKFDYTKGLKFSTYATWWIKQSLNKALGDQARTVRVPLNVATLINAMRRVEEDLEKALGQPPTLEQIAKAMDLSPEKITELRSYNREPVSLDGIVGDGEDPLGNFVADEADDVWTEGVEYGALADEIERVLMRLPEREAHILRLRFGFVDGETRTLTEIAEVYGITRERIRQLEKRAIDKLRGLSDPLKDFY